MNSPKMKKRIVIGLGMLLFFILLLMLTNVYKLALIPLGHQQSLPKTMVSGIGAEMSGMHQLNTQSTQRE